MTDPRTEAGRRIAALCLTCGGPEDVGVHDTIETCDALRGPCLDPGRHHPFLAPEREEAGLQEALAMQDRLIAGWAKEEEQAAADRRWPEADRWRYLANGAAGAVEAIRAALAAKPAEGLDVERLHAAFDAAGCDWTGDLNAVAIEYDRARS